MMLHPDLLPDTTDPEGSVRFENVDIMHLYIPADADNCINHWYEKLNLFVVYDYSPTYTEHIIARFRGTVLEEANSTYSWWKNIIQMGDIEEDEDTD